MVEDWLKEESLMYRSLIIRLEKGVMKYWWTDFRQQWPGPI